MNSPKKKSRRRVCFSCEKIMRKLPGKLCKVNAKASSSSWFKIRMDWNLPREYRAKLGMLKTRTSKIRKFLGTKCTASTWRAKCQHKGPEMRCKATVARTGGDVSQCNEQAIADANRTARECWVATKGVIKTVSCLVGRRSCYLSMLSEKHHHTRTAVINHFSQLVSVSVSLCVLAYNYLLVSGMESNCKPDRLMMEIASKGLRTPKSLRVAFPM